MSRTEPASQTLGRSAGEQIASAATDAEPSPPRRPLRDAALRLAGARPICAGRFLAAGGRKLYVRGATYGTFAPEAGGVPYPSPEVVGRDFAAMAANEINAVRTYTVPPGWLLDEAQRHELRVMVGVPWEEHVTFLDDRRRCRTIEAKVRDGVRACASHPAVLCYAIGNEIPAPIVRWHGRRRIERFLERLFATAKEADPESLVTYVNYPTTEYLQLEFVDLCCFNVFLESRATLASYLARLQNVAGDRPLVIAELGLDSRRNGLEGQARSLDWQLRTAFEAGCAGAFVFAWTDRWHRDGREIGDWDFGLIDRERAPKPALGTVRAAFADVPLRAATDLPRVTVAVCAYNAAGTLRRCLEHIGRLEYPDFETIVVDDGSTDETASIAAEFDVHLTRQENRGLGAARNTALRASTGEIVAFIDADAFPDEGWLGYLVATLARSDHVGAGGPNIIPLDAGTVEQCVAHAPGGPVHILETDTVAEHIPGCNMAFRRQALVEIGGFDPRFRIAGDDVDACWRLQSRGWTLAYSPAAMVWHHRRATARGYWRQQLNYGRAEAMLEQKWPEKYNRFGQPTWRGRIYGNGGRDLRRARIYHGVWGTSAYQSIYGSRAGSASFRQLVPEWYLAIAALAFLSAFGFAWKPLFLAAPILAVAVAVLLAEAVRNGFAARFSSGATGMRRLARYLVTAWLHLLQPLARLTGRLGENLTPWSRRGVSGLSFPWPRSVSHWSEDWRPLQDWLSDLEHKLRAHRVVVLRGGEWDRWDLEAWCGLFGGARALMTVEEHGWGKQLIRVRVRPRFAGMAIWLAPLIAGLAFLAGLDGAWFTFAALAAATLALLARTLFESAAATRSVWVSVREWDMPPGS